MKTQFMAMSIAALFLGSAWATVHGCAGGVGAPPAAKADDDAGTPPAALPATGPCMPAPPAQLTSYSDVLAALKAGSRVRVVMNYAKCQLDGKPGPNALGAMNFDTFEFFGVGVVGNAKEYFAASENHLIRLPSGFVFDYVRVKASSDQAVEVDVVYSDQKTLEVSVDEKFACKIDDGVHGGAVMFYKSTP